MLRERDGPPAPSLLALAGLAIGYAVGSEYPLFFVGAVLGLYLLSRRDALNVRGVLTRAGAYIGGGVVGIVPLLLYNHYAFHSWTHLAYSDVPRQQKGFFGIDLPSLKVLATLLFDSRGLLTISPVLIMGAIGAVLLYRRGKRAEALTIGGVCLCYVGYNSGYYLPFGGGFMGPRFLTTMLPFLAVPLGVAFKRFPGPTIALAAVSIATTVIATITHPLIGYENEAVIWTRYLTKGNLSESFFQPTIASSFGAGRGWGGIWPFLLAAGLGVVLATLATARMRLTLRSLGAGALALLLWGLFAALAPTELGIDHQGLLSIVGAGDHTALDLKKHDGALYPLDETRDLRRDRRRARPRRRPAAAQRSLRAGAGARQLGRRRTRRGTRRRARVRPARCARPFGPPRRQWLLTRLMLHLAPCSFLQTVT